MSLLGDGIYLVALPFTVLATSAAAPRSLSLVGLAWSLGMVGFLLAGGLLADRYDKRRQLLIADALRLVARSAPPAGCRSAACWRSGTSSPWASSSAPAKG